jgi:hypothetical protein
VSLLARLGVCCVGIAYYLVCSSNVAVADDVGAVDLRPSVDYPLNKATDGQIHIKVCGQFHTMNAASGIKKLVKNLPNIHWHKPGHDCPSGGDIHPVRIVRANSEETWGLWAYTLYGGGQECTTYLNTDDPVAEWLVQHEFLHCLGMNHTKKKGGMMSIPTPSYCDPSQAEWRQLHKYYG